VLDVARGEHDFVSGLHPRCADGTAHPARADDADLRFSGGKQRHRQGNGDARSPGKHEKPATIVFHGNASIHWIIRFRMAASGSRPTAPPIAPHIEPHNDPGRPATDLGCTGSPARAGAAGAPRVP